MAFVVDDASCQTNKAEKISSSMNTEAMSSNKDNHSISIGTDNYSDSTDNSSMATLPPIKTQLVSTPRSRPRAAASKVPVRQGRPLRNRNGSNSSLNKIEVSKRSTSVADLRELSKTRAKRRNVQEEGTNSRIPTKGMSQIYC